jgi:peptide/nickel transport system substrate-binding protein
MLRRTTVLAIALALAAGGAHAQDARTLTVGASSASTGMDPHYHSSNMNNGQLRQVFDLLLDLDTSGRIVPRLAESWRLIDDVTWEFKLREGVRFHDGTPFEAEDIAFTFARIPTIPNSPGPFTPSVRRIKTIEVVDPRTVRFVTDVPHPFLDFDVAGIMMLSRKVHEGMTLADFNSGRAMIGTGAYRFVSYTIGERLELVRNDAHWGGRPDWDRVVTRVIPNASARVAALLSGEVDLIDFVPVQDVRRLSNDPRLAVYGIESNGTVYLFPDAVRDQAPFVTDRQGRPLDRNPMKDARVRQAMSMAINRDGIVERLLEGQGGPASQFAAPSLPGRAPELPPLPYDLDRARALLAEAGFPDGFRMTVHGPNGWFANDGDVMQAIAQGFTRIGIETRVELLPPANLFTRATNREFAMFMSTFTTAYAANMLRQVVMTRDPEAGTGPFNRQRYSNPELDALVRQALSTMDEERRNAIVAAAMRLATREMAVIPVFYLKLNWAARRDRLVYDPSPSWYTNALLATPVN